MRRDELLTGPVVPAAGWYPPIRYLLRRARVLDALARHAPGEVLEVGCGAGALLSELAGHGYRCVALEASAEARARAAVLAAARGAALDIRAAPADDFAQRFDLVLALDVLEHVEDDAGALAQWRTWLKPGGTLLISVPAHRRSFGAGDVWAGHFRRYERDELRLRVAAAGYAVDRLECYGFPVANLGEIVAAPYYRRRIIRADATQSAAEARVANNDRSGVDRGAHRRTADFLTRNPAGRALLRAALLAQRPFLATDFGSGYVLRAQRP